ncbi:histidine phosphatase family protein [Nocardioides sp. W3-2-3]|nr:histidine phosphatase family protein [Nocardioides convexus]
MERRPPRPGPGSTPRTDEVGLEQARAVAPLVAALEPVTVVSSDLARAAVTAQTVARACGLEASYDARLREFALGDLQGLTHAEPGGPRPRCLRPVPAR